MITTHNRLRDLQRTLQVLGELNPQPDEMLICADACTDGTVEFLAALPNVRLTVNKVGRGSIASRASLIREASSDIILSFDDDSQPVETDFVRGARELFERNPMLAVADFPQRSDEYPESLTQEDFGPPRFAGTYINASAAIRRSVFLELGGTAEFFIHAYDEPDFSLRCIAAGWQVRYETSLHVRHYYSGVQRNELRTHHFHSRNELWSVMMRCPAPYVIGVALFRIARQFNHARKHGLSWLIREPVWWMSFLAGLPQCLAQRKPLPWKKYWAWMNLIRRPIVSEQEWKERFSS